MSNEIQTPYFIMTPQIKGYDQNIQRPCLLYPLTITVGGVCFIKCESGETILFFITWNCF